MQAQQHYLVGDWSVRVFNIKLFKKSGIFAPEQADVRNAVLSHCQTI